MTDATLMLVDPDVDRETMAPNGADAPVMDEPHTAPPAEVAEQDDLPDTALTDVPEAEDPRDHDALHVEAMADDASPWSPGTDPQGEDTGSDALDGTMEMALPEAVATTMPDRSDTHAPGAEDEVTPLALVTTLIEAATPRRNKRRRRDDAPATGVPEAVLDDAANDKHDEPVVIEGTLPRNQPASQPGVDASDEMDWRAEWPSNAVHIVGRLLPRLSEAPVLDGVQRTRMELALVEHDGSEFGTMGNLPIFVMPGAPGFTPIANELRRARKLKRRLDPIIVEVHGVLRQMPDRDMRYTGARYTVLMGVEVHQITRVAPHAEQFAYWRGRAQVTATRRYEHTGIAYQRVTAVVALKQRKPRLRGTSLLHIPVEFLVAPEHEHADRFRHIGQHLLIEATIGAEVHRMSDHHPALEGIDDPRLKSQLQVIRETVVAVTLGEFPDDTAEHAYRAWVKAGRPRPQRDGRAIRSTSQQGLAPAASSDRLRANEQRPMQDRRAQPLPAAERSRHAPHRGSRTGKREQDDRHGSDRKKTGS